MQESFPLSQQERSSVREDKYQDYRSLRLNFDNLSALTYYIIIW